MRSRSQTASPSLVGTELIFRPKTHQKGFLILRKPRGSEDEFSSSLPLAVSSPVLFQIIEYGFNGPRHIGHVAGFGVPSDVYARYERMKGNDVLMVSGTDEHGTPILVEADTVETLYEPRQSGTRSACGKRPDWRSPWNFNRRRGCT